MSDVLLLSFSMAACLATGICNKVYVNRHSRAFDLLWFDAITGLVAMLTVLLMNGGGGIGSPFSILLGVAFGMMICLQALTFLYAIRLGPWSYTSVISTLSMIIPALSGALFWNEKITVFQLVGMVFLILCLFCSMEKESDKKRTSVKWFGWCLLNFLLTGGIGVMQKFHQSSPHAGELPSFLISAFAVKFVFSLLLLLYKHEKGSFALKTPSLVSLGVIFLAGASMAANHQWNLYLSGVIDSAVFFPLVNGGNLVLTTLTAACIFREHLQKRQWIGVAVGVIAVLCLCVTFG